MNFHGLNFYSKQPQRIFDFYKALGFRVVQEKESDDYFGAALALTDEKEPVMWIWSIPEGKEQNAEESVKAATKYLAQLSRSFSKVTDPVEKMKFVLGAYNAGIGHVFDAMALAEKYGKNKYVWDDNVDTYILLKSNEEYFNDPVCKNGYFRGRETFNFVKNILGRAEMYKQKIKD